MGHSKQPKGTIEESMYDMLEAIQHICGVVPKYQLLEAMTTNKYQSWRQLQDRYTHKRSTFSVDVQTWFQLVPTDVLSVFQGIQKTLPIAEC